VFAFRLGGSRSGSLEDKKAKNLVIACRIVSTKARIAGPATENDMKTIMKRTIVLTLTAAAAFASITPSLAQELRGVGPQAYIVHPNAADAYAYDDRAYRSRAYNDQRYGDRGYAYAPSPDQYGYYGYGYASGADAYASQGYMAYPQCWTDDGYGRRATCENSGGGS
jgi:hypothetical protein